MPITDVDYTSLDAVKDQLKLATTDSADDILVQTLITQASALMSEYCGRSFGLYRRSIAFDAVGSHITATTLDVDELLEPITITNGNSTTISASNYVLRSSDSYPKWRIELKSSSGLVWTYSTDWQEAITIDAFWGCHEDYTRALVDTLENVPIGGLTDSATSFTASDADANDSRGRKRFATGMYLRIDNELLKITAINTSTNAVTVLRGVNGATAAAHTAGVDIKSYQPMPNIEKACIDLTVWLYRNRDTAGERIRFLDGTQIITNEAPANIQHTLRRYVKGVAYSI